MNESNKDRAGNLNYQHLQQESIVVTAHDDIPCDISNRRAKGETHVMSRIHLPRNRKGGVNLSVMNIGGEQIRQVCLPGTQFPIQHYISIRAIEDMYDEEKDSAGEFFIVKDKSDLDKVDNKSFGVILHMEGGKALMGQLSMLKTYYRLGVRSFQPVWFGKNDLGDACNEPSPGGLSGFGRQVIELANELGMMLDVSHASDPVIEDMINIGSVPVMASHCNSRVIANHNRNLTDDQMKKIADVGGFIGVVFVPRFVHPEKPTVEHVADHVEYLVDKAGIDHVGIGADFTDYCEDLIDMERVARGVKLPPGMEVDGMNNVTDLPNLTHALQKRKFAGEDIKKILGMNFLRYAKEILK